MGKRQGTGTDQELNKNRRHEKYRKLIGQLVFTSRWHCKANPEWQNPNTEIQESPPLENRSHKIAIDSSTPRRGKSKQRTSSYETFKNCNHTLLQSGDWKEDWPTFDKEQAPQELCKLSNGSRPNSQDCNVRRWQHWTVSMYVRCVTPKGNNPPKNLAEGKFRSWSWHK